MRSAFILALAGLAAAAKKHGFSTHKGLPSSNGVLTTRQDGCLSFEIECDTNYCIDSLGECCGTGNGDWCDIGTYCVSDGCCDTGSICDGDVEDDTGDSGSCGSGMEPCGDMCMPEGKVCCAATDTHCDAGETCAADGFCETDDSSSDSGSSSDDTSDDTSGCLSTEEPCGDMCMPAGKVCCADTDTHCDAGMKCAAGGLCEPEDSGSDSPSSSSDDGSSLCSRKVKVGGGGGGGDDEEGEDGCGGSGSADGLTTPNLLLGLVAALPLML